MEINESTAKATTLAEAWGAFERETLPPGSGVIRYYNDEMRRAFASGAAWLLVMLAARAEDPGFSDARGVAMIARLDAEIAATLAELQEGRS